MKSKRMKTVAALLPLIGVIFGIILGFACEVNVETKWYNSADYVFNVGLMFETWMFFDLVALFFSWLASVLEKLENIEKSICGKSNTVKEDKTFNDYIQPAVNSIHKKIDKEPTETEWKCPKCGKINQNYVGTCGCGEVKPK